MPQCHTCQHIKRAEIDRRLAAGEPGNQIARDYGVNPSSLHRHRSNCLGLPPANAIMKETARGTAAVALLPSKEGSAQGYQDLRDQIDQIVQQAKEQGSLQVALRGLNTIRQTLDSLGRLAGHDRAGETEVNVQSNIQIDTVQIAERLIEAFDHEPDIKARIAQALVKIDDQLQGIGNNAVH